MSAGYAPRLGAPDSTFGTAFKTMRSDAVMLPLSGGGSAFGASLGGIVAAAGDNWNIISEFGRPSMSASSVASSTTLGQGPAGMGRG